MIICHKQEDCKKLQSLIDAHKVDEAIFKEWCLKKIGGSEICNNIIAHSYFRNRLSEEVNDCQKKKIEQYLKIIGKVIDIKVDQEINSKDTVLRNYLLYKTTFMQDIEEKQAIKTQTEAADINAKTKEKWESAKAFLLTKHGELIEKGNEKYIGKIRLLRKIKVPSVYEALKENLKMNEEEVQTFMENNIVGENWQDISKTLNKYLKENRRKTRKTGEKQGKSTLDK
jgi:hypothetical protein